jgi:YrbI family 3-deoxy-D-manno-octulosonate 8-phosphate phosphatase
MKLNERCQPIELILSDVDGVLTDGGIVFDNRGIESKRFQIRDGMGIQLWHRAGGKFGIITGRSSHVVELRAAELGIDIVRQGSTDKLSSAKDILRELDLKPEQVCYVGDDLPDLPLAQYVGLSIAVSDACAELRERVHQVTKTAGGQGAIREVVELILKAQQRWSELIRAYGV